MMITATKTILIMNTVKIYQEIPLLPILPTKVAFTKIITQATTELNSNKTINNISSSHSLMKVRLDRMLAIV